MPDCKIGTAYEAARSMLASDDGLDADRKANVGARALIASGPYSLVMCARPMSAFIDSSRLDPLSRDSVAAAVSISGSTSRPPPGVPLNIRTSSLAASITASRDDPVLDIAP